MASEAKEESRKLEGRTGLGGRVRVLHQFSSVQSLSRVLLFETP